MDWTKLQEQKLEAPFKPEIRTDQENYENSEVDNGQVQSDI